MSIENTLKIVKRVEATHRNLGLPTVISKLVDLSDLGLFIVAERAKGKGAILDAVMQLRHRKVMKVSRVTPAGLAKIAKELSDTKVTFINPDITGLYSSYLKDAAINVIAHLISEHSVPQSWTAQYQYSISNCFISFLGGIQPKLMRELTTLPNWESMYKDRYLRMYLIYPFGTPNYIKDYPHIGDIFLPAEFNQEQISISRDIRRERSYIRLKTILERQTSEGRSGQYLDALLRAHAFLNQREMVLTIDLDILELATPYFMIDYWLSERQALASPLKLDPNGYVLLFYMIEHGEASKAKMRAYWKVSQSTMTRAIQHLREKHIIVGTYGKDLYTLNPDWYKRYIAPLINWGNSIGILGKGLIDFEVKT